MEVLYLVLAIVWSVLCLVLFFKIWGMTNDVREIKNSLLGHVETEIKRDDSLINVGDFAINVKTNETVMIAEINTNGTFKCIDPVSHKLIGVFSAEELEKKR